MYPSSYKYTQEHEWVGPAKDDAVRVGLTDYAQKQLGDVVFVELPKVGDVFKAGDPVGTIESVKAVSEVYAPVAGKVVAINEDLNDSPEDINEDAHATWLVEIKMSDPKELKGLLTADQYEAYIAEQG